MTEAEFLPLDDPVATLAALGKDPRLVPYGGGNFGMPLSMLEPQGAAVVPNDRFFMRSNGPVPVIDDATWSVAIGGHVERRLSVSLADLRAMPQRTVTAVLECAGNGRTSFDPIPEGTPWLLDAAGCAAWEGVPLAALLDRVGVRDGAVDVVAQGADFPEMQRGLPLAVAHDPDTLVALRMNGEPLPVAHGGPARMLVPGWAGIASTKWLAGIAVLDRAFDGFWNADNYVIWSADGEPLRPVAEMPVRSVIAAPEAGARVPAGRVRVSGYAWSGYGAVRRVELSADGGATWRDTPFVADGRRAWGRWETVVDAEPGELVLMVRATDERRLSQPMAAVWNLKGYQQNGVQRVDVTVVAGAVGGG
jgi:DMSO/TMAO reductase YedYZ molybdopterin-dependent catalytic subunit